MNQHVCQSCQKNIATVHEFIVATKEEKHLCEECYQKLNLQQASQVMPMEALKKLFLQGQPMGAQAQTAKETSCSTCGMTINQFRKQGRFGCQDCYSAFRNHLTALLESVHGDTRHVGMTPDPGLQSLPLPAGKRRRRQRLEQKLELAVAGEDYEEAARLRDEIKRLEAEEDEGS